MPTHLVTHARVRLLVFLVLGLVLLGISLPRASADSEVLYNPTLGVPPAAPLPLTDAADDEWRGWCRSEVARRVLKLDLLDAEVAASLSLSSAHRGALVNLLSQLRADMGAADAQLVAAGDRAAIDAVCSRIEPDHLVFSLQTPKVQNVIGADTVVTRSRSLKSDSDLLGPQIDAAATIGSPHVTRMRELNAEVVQLVTGARANVAGVADGLLALGPADWLANRQVVAPFQETNRQARNDLTRAKELIDEIRRLLQWTPPDATPPVIVATVTGTQGANGWYQGDVSVAWSVTDAQSAVTASTGCDAQPVTTDTNGVSLTCSATSEGGTAEASVTVKRDGTAPVVSYASTGTSFMVDQEVRIACSASDATSGLATGCQGVSAPAWSFGLGAKTATTSVKDKAGNGASATTTFTVTVTPASLCNLTTTFVRGSSKYRALSAGQRKVVDALSATACKHANALAARLSAAQKKKVVALYKNAVGALQKAGWLSAEQAAALKTFADGV